MRLAEMHGVEQPETASLFNRRLRPRILDCTTLPAPESVARRLGVPPSSECLRLEYVALFGEEPVGIATNYIIAPEAERIRRTPFVSDWYALLGDAGVDLGDSEVVLSCSSADSATAHPLGVALGTPLMSMEQVIHDSAGRAFDLAFIHTRGDRFLLTSRIGRGGAGLRWLG
jgi:GntR family transcriptional regulator